MGAHLAVARQPLELSELLAFAPTDPAPPSPYRSNLKVWRFFTAVDSPHEVQSAGVGADGFGRLHPSESYVILHIYRREDPQASGQAAKSADGGARGGRAHRGGEAGGGASCVTLADLAESSQQLLTPRGLAASFSGYDDCGPYPFEERDRGEPLAHDIYVWNGNKALALTKAVALTRCFELERYLLSDATGATRHLHSGAGAELVPLGALFGGGGGEVARAAAIVGGGAAASNHLLAQLLAHRDADAINCSALVASMLPALAGSPDAQAMLFAHGSEPQAAAATGAVPPHAAAAAPAPAPALAPEVSVPRIGLGGMRTAPPVAAVAPPPKSARGGPVPKIDGLFSRKQNAALAPAAPECSVPKIGLGALRQSPTGTAASPGSPTWTAEAERSVSAAERSVPKIGLGALKPTMHAAAASSAAGHAKRASNSLGSLRSSPSPPSPRPSARCSHTVNVRNSCRFAAPLL